jgi:hypothetical protein
MVTMRVLSPTSPVVLAPPIPSELLTLGGQDAPVDAARIALIIYF